MNGQRFFSPVKGSGKSWQIALLTILFVGIFVFCILYFRLSSTPIAGYNISPSNDLSRWQFSLEDGTVLEPADGELPLTETDAVVICRTLLTEELSSHPCFVVTAGYTDCVICLNDSLVYSPSGRFDGDHFAASGYTASAASGQFVAQLAEDSNLLTMRVQFQGEDRLIRHLPKLTLYYDMVAYRTQPAAATAEAAVPAGIYFALALFLSAMFFFGAWKGRQDAGLLLLAFCALSVSLSSTAPYAINVVWTYLWVSISAFCSMLPLVAMNWSLWCRMSRRFRLFLLPVISLMSAVLLYYLIAGFGKSSTLNAQINIMQTWVVPGVLLLTLIAAVADAIRGNPWFRRFFRYLVLSLPVVALAWGISALTGGKLAQSIATAFRNAVDYRSLFRPCELLCILMLIIMFIQAVLDLIAGLIRRDAELQALSLREKYAVENMKLMMETQESTRRERHEMRHHIALISEMLSAGQQERAQKYADSLLDKVDALPSDSYSANPVINSIAGRYLNEAKVAGITVNKDIRDTEKVVLRDDELCVLLTNMLENALEACMKMPEKSERFIRFKLRASEEHLVVSCENSTDIPVTADPDGNSFTTKEDPEHHGFGLPVMRQIVKAHNGQLTVNCSEGVFSLKAIL